MSLRNRTAMSKAREAIKQGKPLLVVTISGSRGEMPKEGEELVAMGYKLHTIAASISGVTEWHFVLPEIAI